MLHYLSFFCKYYQTVIFVYLFTCYKNAFNICVNLMLKWCVIISTKIWFFFAKSNQNWKLLYWCHMPRFCWSISKFKTFFNFVWKIVFRWYNILAEFLAKLWSTLKIFFMWSKTALKLWEKYLLFCYFIKLK